MKSESDTRKDEPVFYFFTDVRKDGKLHESATLVGVRLAGKLTGKETKVGRMIYSAIGWHDFFANQITKNGNAGTEHNFRHYDIYHKPDPEKLKFCDAA